MKWKGDESWGNDSLSFIADIILPFEYAMNFYTLQCVFTMQIHLSHLYDDLLGSWRSQQMCWWKFDQNFVFLSVLRSRCMYECFSRQMKLFKPPIWKTGSTSCICIGLSNNNTAANSRLLALGFKNVNLPCLGVVEHDLLLGFCECAWFFVFFVVYCLMKPGRCE